MDGNPLRLRRQIALCNQVGLFGVFATTPYQVFYYLYDFAVYCDLFIANLIFIFSYLSVLFFNYRRCHDVASSVLLLNSAIQLFFVTSVISAEAGVHLFYFTFAAVLCFLYQHISKKFYIVIMALQGTLYLLSNFLFTPDKAVAPVPSPWVDIMYAGSVAGMLMLSGTLLYLFRQQIDHAEDELTRSNQHLQTLSHTDPMTGLANRRALDSALEREWARLSRRPGEQLAVIMCDVDHFKQYNDHYGHDVGDRCLQQVAATLKNAASRSSDLAARYGGEEFALLLPGTDEQGARRLAEKVRAAIECLQIPNAAVAEGTYVTVSLGVSSSDRIPEDDAHDVESLLKQADQALYRAKESGRNRVASH